MPDRPKLPHEIIDEIFKKDPLGLRSEDKITIQMKGGTEIRVSKQEAERAISEARENINIPAGEVDNDRMIEEVAQSNWAQSWAKAICGEGPASAECRRAASRYIASEVVAEMT